MDDSIRQLTSDIKCLSIKEKEVQEELLVKPKELHSNPQRNQDRRQDRSRSKKRSNENIDKKRESRNRYQLIQDNNLPTPNTNAIRRHAKKHPRDSNVSSQSKPTTDSRTTTSPSSHQSRSLLPFPPNNIVPVRTYSHDDVAHTDPYQVNLIRHAEISLYFRINRPRRRYCYLCKVGYKYCKCRRF